MIRLYNYDQYYVITCLKKGYKSLNVLSEYQTLLFPCIYQFAVVDLGEGPGTPPPLFWVGSVGLGRPNFEHNAISGTVGMMLA